MIYYSFDKIEDSIYFGIKDNGKNRFSKYNSSIFD